MTEQYYKADMPDGTTHFISQTTPLVILTHYPSGVKTHNTFLSDSDFEASTANVPKMPITRHEFMKAMPNN